MSIEIPVQPLTSSEFEPFGDILDTNTVSPISINFGRCRRFSDLANIDIENGDAGISLFKSELVSLPYQLGHMERHPKGSQAFIPMSQDPFLVVVANDAQGQPDTPKAFITKPDQGINFHRNIWHGVLTPVSGSGLFAVIDRIGEGNNLEEFTFDDPFLITG